MTKDFDLASVLEGLEGEDALEFLRTQLNPKTKQAFLESRKSNALRQEYQQEMNALNTSRMGSYERLNAVMRIKQKYQARGLEIG